MVRIKRPKLRLGIGRNNHQFSSIEESGVANCFNWLTASLNDAEPDSNIWRTGAPGFSARLLQVSSSNLVPAGLRTGGVTHHFLTHQNVVFLRTWSTLAKGANHGTPLARGDLCLLRETEQRILEMAESAASLLNPPPSLAPPVTMRCTTVGGLERFAR